MTDDYEPDICSACNGSGEGMHDGSTCRNCKGKGVTIDTEQLREEAEARAEHEYELWKEQRYGY